MSNSEHLIKDFYPFIAKPAFYVGNELNSILKKVEEIQLNLALVHTDFYERGIADLDFEQLYYRLNALAKVQTVRAFCPDGEAESVLRDAQIPLFALENKQTLAACEGIILYVPSPLHFLNIFTVLDLCGIAAKRCDRSNSGPLLMGIGPALLNPEPVAELFDLIIPGASGQPLTEIASRLLADRTGYCRNRSETLVEISRIEGVYVPEFYEPSYNSLGEFEEFRKLHSAVPNRISVSRVAEQASGNCRVKPLLPFVTTAREAINPGTLISPPFSRHDFPAREEISPARSLWRSFSDFLAGRKGADAMLFRLHAQNRAMDLWRMLAGNAWITGGKIPLWPELALKELLAGRWNEVVRNFKQSGLVLNLGAGGERLRRILNLNLSESEIKSVISAALQGGWNRVSLVFQIGLPGEKEADMAETLAFLRQISALAKNFPNSQIVVYPVPFIPVPKTALQWEGFCPIQQLRGKYGVMEENLKEPGFMFQFFDPLLAAFQTAVGRGDRRVLPLLREGWSSGLRYTGPAHEGQSAAWQEFFAAHRQEIAPLLRPVSITRNLPWDHINAGPANSTLKEEKSRALRREFSPDVSRLVGLGPGVEQQNFFRRLHPGVSRAAAEQASGETIASPPETGTTLRYGRQSRKHSAAKVPVKKRLRISYSRQGLASFLTGPALLRAFELAALRGGIHIAYSQGRIPRPRIFLGPGLPTGISGRREFLDMEVTAGNLVSPQREMNQHLPDGLRINDVRVLFAKLPGLSAVVNLARYEIDLSGIGFSEDWLRQFLETEEIRVDRPGKTGPRSINIRPYVSRMFLMGERLHIDVRFEDGKTARITEILESLLQPRGIDYRRLPIERTGLFIERNGALLSPLTMETISTFKKAEAE